MMRSTIGSPRAWMAARSSHRVGPVWQATIAHDRLAVPLRREERAGGASRTVRARGQLAGCRLGQRPVGGQHLVGSRRALHAMSPPVIVRADVVEAEREAGDDAEVAAAAPERPEQVGVLVPAGGADAPSAVTISTSSRLSTGPAEPAGEVAEAAAERQPGDAGLRHEAQHGASPCSWVAWSTSLSRHPAPTWACSASTSTTTSRMPGHVERQPASAPPPCRRCCGRRP